MPNVFAVIGQHREDPDHLLVLGEDGAYYDYVVPTGQAILTTPDASWTTDPSALEMIEEVG